MSVPICTALEFSDGFDEALSELASQLGSFVSSSSSGRRLNEDEERQNDIFCSTRPGIMFGLEFDPLYWIEELKSVKYLSLDKMRFSKLDFGDSFYMIHLTDLSLTPTASLQFDLKWPCG